MTEGAPEEEARSRFIKLAAQLVAQILLEAARTDFLGREPYEWSA
jgi:hypothetical protein